MKNTLISTTLLCALLAAFFSESVAGKNKPGPLKQEKNERTTIKQKSPKVEKFLPIDYKIVRGRG